MFDFDKFKAAYFEDNALNLANRDVYALFNRYISELQKSGNVGNLEKPDYLTTSKSGQIPFNIHNKTTII